jgi:murein DD-endopeptidase MepM/ murein hydrolase activator NlpD
VARHRSPQGRRTHLRLPLPPVAAAAGAGGAGYVTASAPLSAVVAPRVIAAVLAGGALAAAGQTALSQTLPVAADGANMLKLSVQELVGTAPAADSSAAAEPVVVAPLVSLPVAMAPDAEPAVAGVSELVKAAQLRARAAAADAPADVPALPVDGPAARVADLATGGVQMVTGRVSSGFGGRWGKSHNGIDIAAPVGTPIHAPMAGEVIASGPASGFGLWVRVRHDDGTVTTYGHVNRSLVQVGEQVTAGEEIAEVGNRGRSTGPHLHMEVQTPGGTAVNPRPWLDGHGVGY